MSSSEAPVTVPSRAVSPAVTVHYRLAEEYRRQVAAETGGVLPEDATAIGTFADLSPATRKRMVDRNGVRPDGYDLAGAPRYSGRIVILPQPPTGIEAAVAAWCDAADAHAVEEAARRGAAEAEQAAWQSEMSRLQAAIAAADLPAIAAAGGRWPECKAAIIASAGGDPAVASLVQRGLAGAEIGAVLDPIEQAEKEAAKASAETEMRRWAAAYGSDRLRRALERGYSAQGIYVTERSALEAPGWTPDTRDLGEWKDVHNPSAEGLVLEAVAIELARRLGIPDPERAVQIVWAALLPGDPGDDPDLEPREAVVIGGYLGRYDLCRAV